jgi:hypothetical protein
MFLEVEFVLFALGEEAVVHGELCLQETFVLVVQVVEVEPVL